MLNLSSNSLLKGVQEDPAGVLQEERRVGQQQRLLAGPAEGEGRPNRGLGAGSHILKKDNEGISMRC